MEGIYTRSGRPVLYESAVLFVDLLGVKEMAFAESAQDNLDLIDSAFNEAFAVMIDDNERPIMPYANFSDSIVVATPLGSDEAQESAVKSLLATAAALQFSLASRGIFMRGGISVGDVCVTESRVFGAGLVRAYNLEDKMAIFPRILIDPEGDLTGDEPHRLTDLLGRESLRTVVADYVRRDTDGSRFVDYIGGTLSTEIEPEKNRDDLVAQGTFVNKRLLEFQGNAGVWEKYRWVSEYHGYAIKQLGLPPEIETEALVFPGSLATRRFD